ncbi:hypothetical protein [Rhabdothermincola salaria]|uniref:hypothetical protein n=1 Tax=Rhabdothermincola salaria TaxID=2903142 RepID=UPI001E62E2EB|nr:hypothetical protein [Rhabdothermincola salaria]MCD9623651.1 hypothetical protein [Rhabdothermincola salaria]
MRHRLTVLLAALLLVVLAACGADDTAEERSAAAPSTTESDADSTDPTDPGSSDEPVVREILSEHVDPPGVPGMTLSLVRYTIAPGAQLAPHVHPGIQMAFIESGTLSYTVESGTAVVRRATGTEEDVTGPSTTSIEAEESVVEVGDMVHFGANDTDAPIVILATLLTEDGAGLSVPVVGPTDPA